MQEREINIVEWAMKDAQRTEALAILAWMHKNRYYNDGRWDEPKWTNLIDNEPKTAEELYELFKKENV